MSAVLFLLGAILVALGIYWLAPDATERVVTGLVRILWASRVIAVLVFAFVLLLTGVPTLQLVGAAVIGFYFLYVIAATDLGPAEDIRRRLN